MDSFTFGLPDAAIEAIAKRVALILDAEPKGELLTVAEAAAYLRCGRRRHYDLRHRGVLEGVKDGGRLLFERAELDRHLRWSGSP